MALPKMQRVFAAAVVAALLMAGAPGRAEAAGTGVAASSAEAWSSFWSWALTQVPPVLRLWLGGGEDEPDDSDHGRRPASVPPPDVDKGSGLDPNGGDGEGD